MQQFGVDYWVPTDMELTGYRLGTFRETVNLLYEVDDSYSNAVDLRGYGLLGLIMPVVEQCNLQFTVSDVEDGTYLDLCNPDGTIYTITLPGAVGAVSTLDLTELAAYRWVKIHLTEVQTADREFIWILKG